MSRREWSVQDGKNRFSELLEGARRAPQTVTKHGKPVAVVVAVDEYERLRRLERLEAPTFAAALLAMPRGDVEFPRASAKARDLDL
jgi:prevent-host-death family protein